MTLTERLSTLSEKIVDATDNAYIIQQYANELCVLAEEVNTLEAENRALKVYCREYAAKLSEAE